MMSAPQPVATTTPVSSNRVGAHAPWPRARPNTTTVETIAPAKAAGVTNAAAPASRAVSAPHAAPPDSPSTYGSASGLRNSTCMIVPANASSAADGKCRDRARQAQFAHDGATGVLGGRKQRTRHVTCADVDAAGGQRERECRQCQQRECREDDPVREAVQGEMGGWQPDNYRRLSDLVSRMRRKAIWAQFKARAREHIGNMVRASNAEMRPRRPVPSGCCQKARLLRCSASEDSRYSRRLVPRIHRFLAKQRKRETKSDSLQRPIIIAPQQRSGSA